MTQQDSLSKTCKNLCLKEPFYGLFLMMLNKKFDKKFPTAGVSKNGINYQLIIGEDFWGNLTDDWRLGILKHELLHISFFHLERQTEFPDADLRNLAMDMEINQYIEDHYLPEAVLSKEDFDAKYDPIAKRLTDDYVANLITLEEYKKELLKIPPRGVYIKDFPELQMDLKKGTRYYYDKLSEAKEQKKQSAQKGESGGTGTGNNGKGTCGSKAMDDLLDQMDAGKDMVFDHDNWKEFENLSESEKKLLRSQTDFHLKEIAAQITKSRGTIPGELSDYINLLNNPEPPKFDWKGYLRNFIGGSTKTYVKKTRRKESKRFADSPGQKILTQKHVLLGIDTSGSVSKSELEEFLGELYHINKTGTSITVVQFDSAISNVAKFNGRDKDRYKIYGRGGTDFNPFCNYYTENHRKFCCGIIFTDGEAPPPEDKVRGKLLWVHSSKSNINTELPGFKIKLTN